MRIGRYETLGVIGKGGMGTVYLARATAAGGFERRVALKVMHEQLLEDPQFVQMFLDEARLAAGIHHPNVVATHDVHHLEHGLFLVMDYVEGPSLHAVLNSLRVRGQPMPLGICLRIFDDALSGLHAAHELRTSDGALVGLVHRDISPDNILIGKDGVARLNDFGLARAQAQIGQTRGGHVKGKLAFLPPEALLLGRLDRRADVYSLGVTLWEALTLRRLFEAESEGLLMGKVIAGATTPPHEVVRSIPLAISQVCMRAIAVDPNSRYSSALELGRALRDAAQRAGVTIASAEECGSFANVVASEDGLLELKPERPSSIPFSDEATLGSKAQAVRSPRRLLLLSAAAVLLLAGGAVGGAIVSARGEAVSTSGTSVDAAPRAPSTPTSSATKASVQGAQPGSVTSAPAAALTATSPSTPPTAASAVTLGIPRVPKPERRDAPKKPPARPVQTTPARFDPDTL